MPCVAWWGCTWAAYRAVLLCEKKSPPHSPEYKIATIAGGVGGLPRTRRPRRPTSVLSSLVCASYAGDRVGARGSGGLSGHLGWGQAHCMGPGPQKGPRTLDEAETGHSRAARWPFASLTCSVSTADCPLSSGSKRLGRVAAAPPPRYGHSRAVALPRGQKPPRRRQLVG